MPLVGDDEPPLLHGYGGREIDPGAENAQNKGRSNVVRQIHLSPVGGGVQQLPAQTDIDNTAVHSHNRNACQPYPGGNGNGSHRSLYRCCIHPDRFLDRFLCLGNHLPLSVDILHRQIRHGAGKAGGFCDLGFGQFQQRYRRRQRHRTQQSEQHHRPQGIGKDLGRAFQQQPHCHDAQNHHAAGQAHVQDLGKNVIHGSPPACRQ